MERIFQIRIPALPGEVVHTMTGEDLPTHSVDHITQIQCTGGNEISPVVLLYLSCATLCSVQQATRVHMYTCVCIESVCMIRELLLRLIRSAW